MKFAPVATPSLLEAVKGCEYHMALAHLVLTNPKYADFYWEESRRGAFVILDNGAWEGAPLDARQLRIAAERIAANEVVLPDVVRNGPATLAAIEEALPFFNMFAGNLAVVVQGSDRASWWVALREVSKRYEDWGIRTVMFPKHIESFFGSRGRMLRLTLRQRLFPTSLEYHMLGMEHRLDQDTPVATTFKFIRGIDSAAPIADAVRGQNSRFRGVIKSSSEHMWSYEASRDMGLVDDDEHERVIQLARRNVECFKEKFAS